MDSVISSIVAVVASFPVVISVSDPEGRVDVTSSVSVVSVSDSDIEDSVTDVAGSVTDVEDSVTDVACSVSDVVGSTSVSVSIVEDFVSASTVVVGSTWLDDGCCIHKD